MNEDRLASPGDVLDDRYVLKQIIGQGGMGQVFWGEQTNLGRKVAIKVLHTRMEDRTEEYEARFRREALAASRLNHPNIVQIVDYGRDPGLGLYLVMEFLIGVNLADLIDHGPAPSPQRCADILIQTLAALEAAHAAQILHRDIKPANIMACNVPGRPDFVKVLDFGIARALDGGLDDLKLTRAGTVCGTPTYMAPEQATGKALDGRADLYAVGTILYEMLTGHLPFDEVNPMDYLVRKVNEDAPPPDVLANGDDVPFELVTICMRGIARHPDHRFADAASFRKALERWLRTHGEPEPRRQGDTTAATPRTPEREEEKIPGLAGLAGLASEDAPTGAGHGQLPGPGDPRPEGPRAKLEADTWAVLHQQQEGAAPELTPIGPDPVPEGPGAMAPPPEDPFAGPAPTAPPPPTPDQGVPASPYPRLDQRLVGRDALLEELADATDRAESSGWGSWMLYGPRGSGKSCLLEAAAARAGAAGWELFHVRPTAEGLSPYLVPGDLLEQPRDEGPRLVVVDDLDLFPTTLQERFFDPLYFQDRPTLVLGAALAQTGAHTGTHRRQLAPLTPSERRALAAEVLGDLPAPDGPELDYPAWLHHRLSLDVERNRLLASPTGTWSYPDRPPWTGRLGATQETGTLVRDRLFDLAPQPQRLLRLLALAPAGLERDALTHFDLGDESLDELLRMLQAASLLESQGLRWLIGSRTIADTLRDQIRPRERQRLCVELADACAHAARYARGMRRRRIQLQEAVLREAADLRVEAADLLESVAELLMLIEQPDRAIEPLRHALELSQSEVEWTTRLIRLTTRLADALTDAGNPKLAWELLDRIEVRHRLGPEYPARVAISRARTLSVSGLATAREAFEQASKLAGEAGDSYLEIGTRLTWAAHLARKRDKDAARRQVEQAETTLELGGMSDHHTAVCMLQLARAHGRTGDKGTAQRRYRSVIDTAERQGLDHAVALARLGLASLLIERGDPKGARRQIDTIRGDRELEPVLKARACLNLGLLHTILRDSDTAQACYREARGWACAAGWRQGIEQASNSIKTV